MGKKSQFSFVHSMCSLSLYSFLMYSMFVSVVAYLSHFLTLLSTFTGGPECSLLFILWNDSISWSVWDSFPHQLAPSTFYGTPVAKSSWIFKILYRFAWLFFVSIFVAVLICTTVAYFLLVLLFLQKFFFVFHFLNSSPQQLYFN